MEMLGAFMIGVASGMVGAISTGGGLISIPGLIFLGLSPVSAIATTRLSAISGGVTALFKYHKSGNVLWRHLPYLMAISVVAGVIGPKLLLQIDQQFIERIIGVLLLIMLPLLFINKAFGTINVRTGRGQKFAGVLLLFLVMIYGTMFGAGGGIFLIYALMYFFGLTVTESNATGTVMWMVGTTTALVTYVQEGEVSFSVGIPLLIGAAIGGYLGAHLALKRGTVWVKWVLGIVIVLSSLKLIVF